MPHRSHVLTRRETLALLANGVTGLRDCGGDIDEIDVWRQEVRGGTRQGPRIFRCGRSLTSRTSE